MRQDDGNNILVTVVIPAYNAEKYILKAMESVCNQRGDFKIELLVIDDASKDKTGTVVNEFGSAHASVRYLKNDRNKGVAESRNIGIRNAKGEYIAFLDSDDWWAEDKLQKQLELMADKNAVLCATGRELMKPDGGSTKKIVSIPEEITYEMLLRTNSIPCSSVLMKTEVAREFYMCRDDLHEDYILWLRILQKYSKVYGINAPLLKSRMSESGKSRNKIKSARMHFGVYRYMGIGIFRSLYYFLFYVMNGIRKYR